MTASKFAGLTHGSPNRATHAISVLAIRQRSADHPMAMFALIVGSAFGSMAMASSSGVAASAPEFAPVRITQDAPLAKKSARLVQISPARTLCDGQAWGGESAECVLAISRENGNGEAREVRMVASVANATTPNVF